jgi:iron(III) transport system permease protein
MPLKPLFRIAALGPALAPSLLPGISLVYLFGKQGLLKAWMGGASIYGPIGIVAGLAFYGFPAAVMMLTTALSTADQRLYEAAESLGAGPLRTFWTVTLPGIRYGLVSAVLVIFTLTITDFGVAKVIGGSYAVLATDIYKQVVGQQDFQMGAVVSVVLLIPAVVAFAIDRLMQRRQSSLVSARSVPFMPGVNRVRDAGFLAICAAIAVAVVGVLGVSGFASLVRMWPYDLGLVLDNYHFDLMDGGGWGAYRSSLVLAASTALAGTAVIFVGAYLVEKARGLEGPRSLLQLLAVIPLAVPGLVLGLAYIFFFNSPANPLHGLYRTMPLLVVCTIVHFYSVGHMTAVTALKQLDGEFEAVSASLQVPFYRTVARVTVPLTLPALLDVGMMLFANAMTTVSALVFLYGPDTQLASVAVLNMDDAGDTAPAAAMAMVIVLTSAAVRVLHGLVARWLMRRTQAWKAR